LKLFVDTVDLVILLIGDNHFFIVALFDQMEVLNIVETLQAAADPQQKATARGADCGHKIFLLVATHRASARPARVHIVLSPTIGLGFLFLVLKYLILDGILNNIPKPKCVIYLVGNFLLGSDIDLAYRAQINVDSPQRLVIEKHHHFVISL
jgi:hypothetical protein